MKENSKVTDINIGDMKNSIEEDIKIVENYLANSAINEIDSNFFKNGGWETVDLEIPKSMQHILSDYKRVLKENEHKTEKIENQKNELAILNNKQKDLKKLQNTLNSYRGQFKRQKKEIKEKDELIEKMKNYLLKENKMCDFLECEEK